MMDMRRVIVKRVALLTLGMIALAGLTGLGTATVMAQETNETAEEVVTEHSEDNDAVRWDVAVAIAAAIAVPCLAAGYAVGKVGAAALGAASEKPELLGRSLTFVALGEGIAIFGFVLALLLSGKF
jgi:V/A-type H+-transporting ATPase subunit K